MDVFSQSCRRTLEKHVVSPMTTFRAPCVVKWMGMLSAQHSYPFRWIDTTTSCAVVTFSNTAMTQPPAVDSLRQGVCSTGDELPTLLVTFLFGRVGSWEAMLGGEYNLECRMVGSVRGSSPSGPHCSHEPNSRFSFRSHVMPHCRTLHSSMVPPMKKHIT